MPAPLIQIDLEHSPMSAPLNLIDLEHPPRVRLLDSNMCFVGVCIFIIFICSSPMAVCFISMMCISLSSLYVYSNRFPLGVSFPKQGIFVCYGFWDLPCAGQCGQQIVNSCKK